MSVVIPDPAQTDWVPLGFGLGGPLPSQPSVRVYRSTAQAIPGTSAPTAISFSAARYDNGPAVHWSASAPTRLTCQVAGTYAIWAGIQLQPAAGGTTRMAAIWLNGTNNYIAVGGQRGTTFTGGGADYPIANTTTIMYLNVGDYVEVYIVSDAAVNTNPSDATQYRHGTEFSMALIGGVPGPPGIGVPTPVVNGSWIKGSGGAAVWSPIAATDFPNCLDANAAGYTDCNNMKQTGWWWLNTNVTNTPVAGMSGAFIQVLAANWNQNYAKQIVYNYTDTQRWERQCNGGTWTAWQKTEGPGSIAWYGPYSVDSGNLGVGGYTHSAITHNLNTYPFVLGHIEDKNWGITLNWAANHTLGQNQTGIYIYCGSQGGAPAGTNRGIWHGWFGVANVSAQ